MDPERTDSTTMPRLGEIPGGDIALRDDRTGRSWTVSLRPFLLDRYPVTQDLYLHITGESPSASAGPRLPVESVSWNDAVRFCNLLSEADGLRECYSVRDEHRDVSCDWEADGYRLATDAEWEYACRAGTKGPRYGELDDIAWHLGNSDDRPQNVGEKAPNAWGLFDMLGNVWEWCWDVYDAEVYGPYRVFRGGGWSDPARGCLAGNRRRSHPTLAIDDLGFRLARSS